MGKPTPNDERPLQPQMTLESLERWGMDFVGPIDPPSGQQRYIMVRANYLNKWAEEKLVKTTTKKKVAKFINLSWRTSFKILVFQWK